MSVHHVAPSQVMMVAGPAKVQLSGEVPVTPAAVAPAITSLSPNTIPIGGPDIQMIVNGSGFNEISKIVFNGYDEPTTMLSPTQVRTIVTPSLFAVAAVLPVQVRNGSAKSNSLNFTFTATELEMQQEKKRA